MWTTADWCCLSVCETEGAWSPSHHLLLTVLCDWASTAIDQTVHTLHTHTLKSSMSGCAQWDEWYLSSLQNFLLDIYQRSATPPSVTHTHTHPHTHTHTHTHSAGCHERAPLILFNTWLHFQHFLPWRNEWTHLNFIFNLSVHVFIWIQDAHTHAVDKGKQ